MAAKTLQNVIRITYRQRRSNFSRRDRKPILEKKNRKLYKKWLITRNYVSLNKYKLYCNKIAIINRIYRDCFYNGIFFRIMAAKTLQNVIRITYRQRRSNFSRRDRKPILEKKNRKLYKKWLITRNYVSLNKYKLYCNKIAIINRIYRDCFYNGILIKSDNTKKDVG